MNIFFGHALFLLFTYLQKKPHSSPFYRFLHCFQPRLSSGVHTFTFSYLILPVSLQALISNSRRTENSYILSFVTATPQNGEQELLSCRGRRETSPGTGNPHTTIYHLYPPSAGSRCDFPKLPRVGSRRLLGKGGAIGALVPPRRLKARSRRESATGSVTAPAERAPAMPPLQRARLLLLLALLVLCLVRTGPWRSSQLCPGEGRVQPAGEFLLSAENLSVWFSL